MATILNFKNTEILFDDHVRMAQKHSRANFCQNSSIHCGDIMIYRFLRWWTCHLGFQHS